MVLSYNKNNLFQNIGQLVLGGLCWIAYDGVFSISLGIVSVIFLPVQWVLIFSLGYCMVGTFDREILGENQKINRKKKTKKHWRDKEYRLLGILVIFAGGIILFWRGYSESNKTAVEKRRFGADNDMFITFETFSNIELAND